MPRNKQKNLARAAAHRAEKQRDARLGRKVEAALSGCSDRVLTAVNQAPNWRVKTDKEAEFVSMENPAYRKVNNPYGQITNARQKMSGKSIPLI
ncbi:hypothetical protein ACMGEE_01355 [Erwinia sp. DT-104]|uniref:hypothetical protein n=1 Tax=Erwinia sp. DT-104 TaxID=3396161 RepID=UPI003F1BFB93